MPKRIKADGKTYVVPDDATDDEINQIVGPASNSGGEQQPQGGYTGEFHGPVTRMFGQPMQLPTLREAGQAAWEGIKGAGKGLLHDAAEANEAVGGMPGIDTFGVPGTTLPRPITSAVTKATLPSNTPQGLGFGAEQAGEFLMPGAVEENAMGSIPKLAKAGKGVRGITRVGMQALDNGAINRMHGDSFGEGAAIGAAGAGLAEGARAIAPAVAESALGITRNMRGFGKTPGAAALEETKGIRPATVGKSARGVSSRLTQELENAARNSKGIADVQPAIDTIDHEITKAGTRNSPARSQYRGIRTQLTNDLETGAPLPIQTTPMDLLERKRGIGDLEKTWTPEQKKGVRGVIPKVYGAMDSELDRTVPGADRLNQRISSLIPVAQRGELEDLNAGLAQRSLHRIAAHTGALTGATFGATEGYHRGGLPGAIAGGITGIAIPEMISSPTGEMTIARGLHAFPRRLPAGISLAAMNKMSGDDEEPDAESARARK